MLQTFENLLPHQEVYLFGLVVMEDEFILFVDLLCFMLVYMTYCKFSRLLLVIHRFKTLRKVLWTNNKDLGMPKRVLGYIDAWYIEHYIDFQYGGHVLVLNRPFLRRDQLDVTETHMVSHPTRGLFVYVAMSVMHRTVTYNCRISP